MEHILYRFFSKISLLGTLFVFCFIQNVTAMDNERKVSPEDSTIPTAAVSSFTTGMPRVSEVGVENNERKGEDDRTPMFKRSLLEETLRYVTLDTYGGLILEDRPVTPPLATIGSRGIDKSTLPQAIEDAQQMVQSCVIPGVKNAIIFLGPTRAGKSTLSNLLCGNELEAVVREGLNVLEVKPDVIGMSGARIYHYVAKPGTMVPSADYIAERNVTLWDCPGFGAYSGNFQKIVDVFSIFKVLEVVENVKLVLVLSKGSLSDASTTGTVIETLKDLTGCFGDLDQLKNMVSLVVTKEKEPRSFEGAVEILTSLSRAENDDPRWIHGRELLAHLLGSRKFTYMEDASIWARDSSGVARTRIWQLIDRCNYVHRPMHKPDIPPASIQYLNTILDELNGVIAGEISANAYQIIDFIKEKIRGFSGENIQALRDDIGRELEILIDLHRADGARANFLEMIKFSEIAGFSPETRRSLFSKIEKIKTLKGIHLASIALPGSLPTDPSSPETRVYDTSSWHMALEETRNSLRALLAMPDIRTSGSADSLCLSGILVGISDVLARLSPAIRKLELYAVNTLFVDADMDMSGRAAVVKMIAPYWKIMGDRKTINLTGAAGNQGAGGTQAGADGSPGLPGGNGGNFYGKGVVFDNLRNLTVVTLGGTGGRGGDGSQGAPGNVGQDADRNMPTGAPPVGGVVIETSSFSNKQTGRTLQAKIDGGWKDIGGEFGCHAHLNGAKTVYRYNGSIGSHGGKGGKAGMKGKGGNNGHSLIETSTLEWVPVGADGTASEGQNGNVGIAGTAGYTGAAYQGTYYYNITGHYDHHHGTLFGTTMDVVEAKQDPYWESYGLVQAGVSLPGQQGEGINGEDRQNPGEVAVFDRDLSNYVGFYESQRANPSIAVWFPRLEGWPASAHK